DVVRWAGAAVAVMSLLAGAGLRLLGDLVIEYALGRAFRAASAPLAIMVWAYCLASLSGVAMIALNMAKKEKVVIWSFLVAVGLNVLLGLVLIPDYQATGAAIAFGISMLVMNMLICVGAANALGVNPFVLSRRAIR